MESRENEAKKLAATYARWLRNPEEALFGSKGEGVVLKMYKALKEAKGKNDVKSILDLSKYEMSKQTTNDMARFVSELKGKIDTMDDQESVKFALEVMRYFQIALATKLEDMRKGLWG